jgi:flagellar FliL protein
MSAAAPAATADGAPPKKGKAKLFIIIGLVVVLLAGGAGAFLLMGKKSGHKQEEAAHEEKKAAPVFAPLETFTVNLADTERERFLQTNISLEVRDAHIAEELKNYNPAIRNRLLILLSSQSSEKLASAEGKEQLAGQIVTQVNGVLGFKAKKKKAKSEDEHQADAEEEEAPAPKPPVINALFSSFVVQ